jgi:predicted alpha/beta superfamily hydrolase
LDLSILGWEDLDGGGGSNSTANEQVMIWDTAMEIPQLGRNRRVWIYLPQDYESTNKFYPVLYMHDGQNVFDASTSFAGEWEVDESLTDLENDGYRGVIVVAVDNGGSHRIDEYSPFTNPSYGGGEGDLYLDFIVETLKPKVDSTFRTLKEAKHTGIMGSSMGGLISHYAHFRNPEVFGRAGIFSPAYWFSNEYFTYTETVGKTDSSKLFILAGALESSIATGSQSMYDQLITMGYEQDELQLLISPDGNHSEWFWAREFKDVFLWLFPNDETLEVEDQKNSEIKVYPNPANGKINIEGQGSMDVKLLDLNGRLVERHEIVGKGILELAHVKAGTTLLLSVERSGKQCYQQVIMTN